MIGGLLGMMIGIGGVQGTTHETGTADEGPGLGPGPETDTQAGDHTGADLGPDPETDDDTKDPGKLRKINI